MLAVGIGIAREPAGGLQVAMLIQVFELNVDEAVIGLLPECHFLNRTTERSFDRVAVIVVRAPLIVVTINTESNVHDAIITLLLNHYMVLALDTDLPHVRAIRVVRAPPSPFEL